MHIRKRAELRHEEIAEEVFSKLPPAARLFPALRSMVWTMASCEVLSSGEIVTLMKRQITYLRDRVEGDPQLLSELARKAGKCAKS